MKVTFSFDNPLNRKIRITKSFTCQSALQTLLIKKLMKKCGEGGMIILPVEVVAESDDGLIETTTIFVSTLSERNNRYINKLNDPPQVARVEIGNTIKENNEQTSFRTRIQSIFRTINRKCKKPRTSNLWW